MRGIALNILSILIVIPSLTFAQNVGVDVTLQNGRSALTDAAHSQMYSAWANGEGNIRNASCRGMFSYSLSNEQEMGYSMLYSPGSYAFYYVDTIRGDVRREQYNVNAYLSYPIKDELSASVSGNIMLGSMAKQRDIRNKNVVNSIELTPNLTWHGLSVDYIFSLYREEVTLRRFGPDIVIPITTCEGLFFGPTEAFGNKHHALYYRTIDNGAAIGYEFKKITARLKYMHSSSDIDTHVDNIKIGREEGYLVALNLDIKHIIGGKPLISFKSVDSYVPVGKKVSDGDMEVFKYFSEVKRHNSEELNIALNDILSISSSESSMVQIFGAASYEFFLKTQTHFVYPQEYQQRLKGHKWYGYIEYRSPFKMNVRGSLAKERRYGDMLTLKDESIEQKYNRNAQLLEKEWEYLISNRLDFGIHVDYNFNLRTKGNIYTSVDVNVENLSIDKKKTINFNVKYRL